ncbi:GNAT family N-acetyltransferase [Ornithinibacillus sp. L9]|uniref:GNAT family N-acetyltransferase n=1 Tax=Ornithinibacillus caprae TaxID=2678566 RepID=A0A6N8FRV9_9BACI|nr:N-acetyltransferase [Ornithinibacillus caprae]MUK90608.1 GNAT family N-acetyltransferase [Ornithinibacillus caprae]
MKIEVRQEHPKDYKTIEQVVKLAFEDVEQSDHTEHQLVARLRNSEAYIPELALVANNDTEELIGHILLTKIKIKNDNQQVDSLALAPVSVSPEYQNKGVGIHLVTNALKKAKDLGYQSVIVLGHPKYYPKFGFKRASMWGIKAPFLVADEVFMALELHENSLENVSGVVEYSSAF